MEVVWVTHIAQSHIPVLSTDLQAESPAGFCALPVGGWLPQDVLILPHVQAVGPVGACAQAAAAPAKALIGPMSETQQCEVQEPHQDS